MTLLVLEDGTGLSGANSFVAETTAEAYATVRGLTAFTQYTGNKEALLVQAADYLRNEQRFPYRGTRLTVGQRLPFPRLGCVERGGLEIPSNAIPWRLADAQCELAALLAGGTSLQPKLDRGGKVTRKKVDVLETEWADDAPVETQFPVVWGFLAPILNDPSTPSENALPYLAEVEEVSPFVTDQFNPSSTDFS